MRPERGTMSRLPVLDEESEACTRKESYKSAKSAMQLREVEGSGRSPHLRSTAEGQTRPAEL